jgi:putative transposase
LKSSKVYPFVADGSLAYEGSQGDSTRHRTHYYPPPESDTAHSLGMLLDSLVKTYELKYPKAAQCLEKDRAELLVFYDFPADRWTHIRTSNPIESTFSTIRLRTKKTRACVSRSTILTMVYKIGLSAEKGWRKLRGFRRLTDVINGIKFIDGVDE